jgi:transcriptional regulator
MYVPRYFQVDDPREVEAFLQDHPFAILVSNQGQTPIATHLPLEAEKREGRLVLSGHLAYANPQWRTFEQDQPVLAIFQGAHAYVSSSWYGHLNVPTWNYMAVHVYGTARIVGEERLKEMLAAMLAKYETGRENAVLWERLPAEFRESQLKAIVGIEIEAERIEAKYKLSQNRNEQDYQAIIDKLEAAGDADANQVAAAMRRIRKP